MRERFRGGHLPVVSDFGSAREENTFPNELREELPKKLPKKLTGDVLEYIPARTIESLGQSIEVSRIEHESCRAYFLDVD